LIGERSALARRSRVGRTINRDHSPVLAQGLPLVTIMLGSLSPLLPIIAAGPVMPPFGFMILIAWRLVRPGIFPLWMGLPLGAFDDLFSGQPFGSAIMLWSLAMLLIEALEARFPWRAFWQDWGSASALLAAYLAISAIVAGAGFQLWHVALIVPQLLLSILLFPILARMVALFDRIRLRRVRVID
jgi:rod shape-determining protein MreD